MVMHTQVSCPQAGSSLARRPITPLADGIPLPDLKNTWTTSLFSDEISFSIQALLCQCSIYCLAGSARHTLAKTAEFCLLKYNIWTRKLQAPVFLSKPCISIFNELCLSQLYLEQSRQDQPPVYLWGYTSHSLRVPGRCFLLGLTVMTILVSPTCVQSADLQRKSFSHT